VKGVKRDIRVIAATNRELPAMILAGQFRKDLYHRLSVAEILLPPLRKRAGEVAPLALSFLARMNEGLAANPRRLTQAALQRLENHTWPGNVRELSHVIERSVLLSRRQDIDAPDLLIQEPRPSPDPFAQLPEPTEGFALEKYLRDVRHQLVLRAVAKANGNLSEAAKLLGVTRQALSKHYRGHVN
jgi:transcriptional regulator with PAS, ATPase and Fis domain